MGELNRMIDWILSFIKGEDKPEPVPENETPEEKTKREERADARRERAEDRKAKSQDRKNYRLEKIAAVKEKFYAVAAKRKWLAILLIAAIAAYLIIVKRCFSFGGEWLDKIKGIF